jgi:hypothetical protein
MLYTHKWVCNLVVGKENYILDGKTTQTKFVDLEKLCNFEFLTFEIWIFQTTSYGETTKMKVVDLKNCKAM